MGSDILWPVAAWTWRCCGGPRRFVVLVLLLSCLCATVSSASCELAISNAEHDALFDLYNTTAGVYWRYNTSLPDSTHWQFPSNSSAPCANHWQGLTCDFVYATQCAITELQLPFYRLRGRLPSSLANLTHLELLELSLNELTGDRLISLQCVFVTLCAIACTYVVQGRCLHSCARCIAWNVSLLVELSWTELSLVKSVVCCRCFPSTSPEITFMVDSMNQIIRL
jgi:hypothetical protein